MVREVTTFSTKWLACSWAKKLMSFINRLGPRLLVRCSLNLHIVVAWVVFFGMKILEFSVKSMIYLALDGIRGKFCGTLLFCQQLIESGYKMMFVPQIVKRMYIEQNMHFGVNDMWQIDIVNRPKKWTPIIQWRCTYSIPPYKIIRKHYSHIYVLRGGIL